MGMGLFISQKILTYFNGRIEFYSELGKGSTFKFWFDMKNATLSYGNTYNQDYDNDHDSYVQNISGPVGS
jgi:signal transduction histidine kinase